jgi:hypothetical protein
MIRAADGKIVTHQRLVSGDQTATEKALGFPMGANASHTEARAVTLFGMKPGDVMTITGQRAPCPSCKGYMNRAAQKYKSTIKYQWREDGKTRTWTARPNE